MVYPSENACHLRMSQDPESLDYYMDKLTVRWNGKESAYSSQAIAKIKNPIFRDVKIYSPTGREQDRMVLVVPFNYRKGDQKTGGKPVVDVVEFVFDKGVLVNTLLAEAHSEGIGKWKMSQYDPTKKVLIDKGIVDSESNPYLRKQDE